MRACVVLRCLLLGAFVVVSHAEPYLVGAQVSIQPNSTAVRIKGANLPSAGNGATAAISLANGTCNSVAWISNSTMECVFGASPYSGLSNDTILPLALLNFTIDGVPVGLYNRLTNGTLIAASYIIVAVLRPPPVILDDTSLVSTEGAGVQIGIGGMFFGSAADTRVWVRTPISAAFPCTIELAIDTLLICNLTDVQEMQLTAGSVEALIVVQDGVSSGWAPIGFDLVPLVATLTQRDITEAIAADTEGFIIEGYFFSTALSNVSVSISQQERVPVATEVPCSVVTVTPTRIVCEVAANSSRIWVAYVRSVVGRLTEISF